MVPGPGSALLVWQRANLLAPTRTDCRCDLLYCARMATSEDPPAAPVFLLSLRRRFLRNALFWLSLLGKWTLMDCLSIFITLGLYHLRASVSLVQAFQALDHECKPVCALLNTTTPGECDTICRDLDRAASLLQLPRGDVLFSLTMTGLVSMTCYCCATLLSISCSALVEHMEVTDRRALVSKQLRPRGPPPARPFCPVSGSCRSCSQQRRRGATLARMSA